MSTLSKEEYLAKTGRGLQPGFGKTTDFADPQVGATAQHPDGIPEARAGLPGQVYTVDQLPHPDNALAYGLPPVVIPEHLITEDDDDPQGPDTLDHLSAAHREELGDPVVTLTGETVKGGSKAALDALKSTTDPDGDTAAEVNDSEKETARERKARERAEAEAAQQQS